MANPISQRRAVELDTLARVNLSLPVQRKMIGIARDDRPWGGTDPPGVAYVYAPDRKAKQPIAHFAGFNGILQVDGYGGYRALAERNDVQLGPQLAELGASASRIEHRRRCFIGEQLGSVGLVGGARLEAGSRGAGDGGADTAWMIAAQ